MPPTRDRTGRNSSSSPLLDAYWRDIRQCAPVSREAETQLVRRARAGDDSALHSLVEANLRFVVAVAKEFRSSGRSLSELISDGNLGLLEAALRFDETRESKFITYAVWWIRQSIRRALERRRVVAPPTNRIADFCQVERVRTKLAQELGRTPTLYEISDSTGFSTRRVQRAIETGYVDVHLDGVLVEDEDSTPVYALHESDDKPPEAQIEQREFVEAMHRCIDSLDDREREIICRYYGFGGALPMTLEEIGSLLGLTRERIRQLRDRGLSKMRAEHGELLTEFSRN